MTAFGNVQTTNLVSTPRTFNITYVSTDSAQNTATKQRQVVVRDTTPPQLVLRSPLTDIVERWSSAWTDPGVSLCTDSLDGNLANRVTVAVSSVAVAQEAGPDCQFFVNANARSNIWQPTSPLTVSTSAPSGTVFVVTYSVRDNAGNVATANRTVTVLDRSPPELSLQGLSVVDWAYDVVNRPPYVDAGVLAQDSQNPSVLAHLCVLVTEFDPQGRFVRTGDAGIIDRTRLGSSFVLNYTLSDGTQFTSQTRRVVIRDMTPPVITLRGSPTMAVKFGTNFTDPGATVSDLCDQNVQLVTAGAELVNTTAPGAYVIQYNATDESGNTAAVTRRVNVLAAPGKSDGSESSSGSTAAFPMAAIGAVIAVLVLALVLLIFALHRRRSKKHRQTAALRMKIEASTMFSNPLYTQDGKPVLVLDPSQMFNPEPSSSTTGAGYGYSDVPYEDDNDDEQRGGGGGSWGFGFGGAGAGAGGDYLDTCPSDYTEPAVVHSSGYQVPVAGGGNYEAPYTTARMYAYADAQGLGQYAIPMSGDGYVEPRTGSGSHAYAEATLRPDGTYEEPWRAAGGEGYEIPAFSVDGSYEQPQPFNPAYALASGGRGNDGHYALASSSINGGDGQVHYAVASENGDHYAVASLADDGGHYALATDTNTNSNNNNNNNNNKKGNGKGKRPSKASNKEYDVGKSADEEFGLYDEATLHGGDEEDDIKYAMATDSASGKSPYAMASVSGQSPYAIATESNADDHTYALGAAAAAAAAGSTLYSSVGVGAAKANSPYALASDGLGNDTTFYSAIGGGGAGKGAGKGDGQYAMATDAMYAVPDAKAKRNTATTYDNTTTTNNSNKHSHQYATATDDGLDFEGVPVYSQPQKKSTVSKSSDYALADGDRLTEYAVADDYDNDNDRDGARKRELNFATEDDGPYDSRTTLGLTRASSSEYAQPNVKSSSNNGKGKGKGKSEGEYAEPSYARADDNNNNNISGDYAFGNNNNNNEEESGYEFASES